MAFGHFLRVQLGVVDTRAKERQRDAEALQRRELERVDVLREHDTAVQPLLHRARRRERVRAPETITCGVEIGSVNGTVRAAMVSGRRRDKAAAAASPGRTALNKRLDLVRGSAQLERTGRLLALEFQEYARPRLRHNDR